MITSKKGYLLMLFVLSICYSNPLFSQTFFTNYSNNISLAHLDNFCNRTILIEFEDEQIEDVITDIVYHPNGKFYACTITHLFEIDVKTGNVINLGRVFNENKATSLTCDKEGVIFCAGFRLHKYDVKNDIYDDLGQLPTQARGDLIFHNEELYYSADDNNFYKLNLENPHESSIFMEFPENSAIIGLTTLFEDNDSYTTYAVGNVDGTDIYELDFINKTITQACHRSYTPFGATSINEFHASNYPLLFDLDLDNSKGGNGVNYYLDTVCTNTVAIVDNDVAVHAAEVVDSIVIQISQNIQAADQLQLEGSFNLGISGHQSPKIVLHNNGNSSFEDFEAALAAIHLVVNSGQLEVGERQVDFSMYPSIGTVQIAQSRLLLNIKSADAGEDGRIEVCPTDDRFDLFDLLGGEPDRSGTWLEETISGEGSFRPGFDSTGIYTYVVENGAYCPSDTAYVDVLVHPYPPFAFDTFIVHHFICFGDTVLFPTPADNPPYTYYWDEHTLVENDTAILTETGIDFLYTEDTNTGCFNSMWIAIEYADTLYLQETIQLCPGETFVFEGQPYTQDTLISYWITSEERCDTLMELQLDFLSIKEGLIDTFLCTGESIMIEGQSFDETGNYQIVTTSIGGCDSLINLQLEIGSPTDLMIAISDFDCEDSTRILSADDGFATYLWSNGAMTHSIEVQESDIYSLIVTDEHGCVFSQESEVEVFQPLEVMVQSNSVSCPEGGDGMLILSVQHGTSPYTYDWNDGSSDSFRSALMAGFYAVTVTDANDCEQIWEGELEAPPAFHISSIIQNASDATANDGSILIENMEGGTPPYQLSWNMGQVGAFELNNLVAESYTLTIIDDNGCVYFETFIVDFNTATDAVGAVNDYFSIIPNPSFKNSKAIIQTDKNIEEVFVLDYLGRVISKQKSSNFLLVPSHAGVFFVKVFFKDETVAIKKWLVD